jgi:hypothetical protein
VNKLRYIERMREEHSRKARERLATVEKAKDAVVAALAPASRSKSKPAPVEHVVPVHHSNADQVRPEKWCQHDWQRIEPSFKKCSKCRVFMARKIGEPGQLKKAFPLLKNKILPPTDPQGRYYTQVIINKYLKTQMSLCDRGWMKTFVLYVKFPKGWLWTMSFTEMQFDRIIRAVDPLMKDYDPLEVYRAAQIAIMGRCWESRSQLEALL